MIKVIVTLSALLLFNANAQLVVKEVQVNCKSINKCYSKENLKTLKGSFESKEHLDELAKIVARSDGVSEISYTLKDNKLIFDVKNNPLVDDIRILLKDDVYDEELLLPISSGEFLSSDLEARSISFLESYFINQGYTSVSVSLKKKYKKTNANLVFNVDYKNKLIVNNITIHSKNQYLQKKMELFFSEQLGQRYRSQFLRNSLEIVKTELFDLGFYFLNLTLKKKVRDSKVFLDIYVQNSKRQAFYIEGVSDLLVSKIRQELKSTTRIYKRILQESTVRDIVSSNLRQAGFADFQVDFENVDRLESENIIISRVKIKKVFKSKITEVLFRGNSYFTEKELRDLFFENATQKASYNYVDSNYYASFMKILKAKYVQSGFVSVKIFEPTIQALKSNKGRVIFKIIEGVQAKIVKIKIQGVSKKIESQIRDSIISQNVGDSFDPIAFDFDLKNIKTFMFNKGYYFFSIKNEDKASLVQYSRENTAVSISLDLHANKPLTLNNVLFLGNIKSKNDLLYKYLDLEKGSVLTRDFVKEYQSRLLGLGVFSNVSIIPLPLKGNKADLIVNVKERDFGVIEIAPGVRTDLGPKLSASITYNNLGGMNRIVSFKGQVNRRFDLSSIDEQRRDNNKSLIEYDTELSYIENRIFYSNLDFSSSISKARRRLFQFDADIQKISYTFSNQFTDWFRASLTQQLETISQFNSTIEREQGKFEIGSITPSVTFDFRNNRINPTSGAYFNLSYERASPDYRSQNNSELKIDYYKIVSRNLFYIPFKNGTFAISLAGGMQENLAKNRFNSNGESSGYIPNVKVFRLSGMDLVRGYNDEEINRLVNGNDISEEIVDEKAYMMNIKLEPRFFVNDTFIAGVFFDAGRVFVDEFKFDQLRSSYGVTFKYLTPVGTLDFDYGIKVLRKREPGGRLESPGRFHVSIGFF